MPKSLEQPNSDFSLLQFFITRFEQRQRDGVPVAWCHMGKSTGHGLISRWRSFSNIDAQFVCASNQPPCSKNTGAKIRRKLRDVHRSADELHFAQFPQEALFLNICLFAVNPCRHTKPTNSGTRHLDEVLCSGPCIPLSGAIRAASNPDCNSNRTNRAEGLHPGRHRRIRHEREHGFPSKGLKGGGDQTDKSSQRQKFQKIGSGIFFCRHRCLENLKKDRGEILKHFVNSPVGRGR